MGECNVCDTYVCMLPLSIGIVYAIVSSIPWSLTIQPSLSNHNSETIVQATKSARNTKLLRYGLIIGSTLFIGGFLVKSYVEERIFERDTQRVLAYYKHAAANSFHDGDERQARYLVWKYKGKKDKLWRRLETKYQVPVRHAWEWEDEEEGGDSKEEKEEEAEDLDDAKEGSKKTDDGEEL